MALQIYVTYPTSATYPSPTFSVNDVTLHPQHGITLDGLPALSLQVEQNLTEFAGGDMSFTADNSDGWWTTLFASSYIAPWIRWPNTVIVKVVQGGSVVWEGDVDLKTVKFDAKVKTVSFTALGALSRLKAANAELCRRQTRGTTVITSIPDKSDWGTTTAVGSGSLTDSSKSWIANAYANHVLIDYGGYVFTIASNTEHVLTLMGSGTPVPGIYKIRPFAVQAFNVDSGNGTANGNVLTDTTKHWVAGSQWPGNYLVDANGRVFLVATNGVNTVTLQTGDAPASGQYHLGSRKLKFLGSLTVQQLGILPGDSLHLTNVRNQGSQRVSLGQASGSASVLVDGSYAATERRIARDSWMMSRYQVSDRVLQVAFIGPKGGTLGNELPQLLDSEVWLADDLDTWMTGFSGDGCVCATPYLRGVIDAGSSGVGGANSFTDSSKGNGAAGTRGWEPHALANLTLTDSLGSNFAIADNTYNSLTIVNGTPASGSYMITMPAANVLGRLFYSAFAASGITPVGILQLDADLQWMWLAYADFTKKDVLTALQELCAVLNCTLSCQHGGDPNVPTSGTTYQMITRAAGVGSVVPLDDYVSEQTTDLVWEHCYDGVRVTGANKLQVTRGLTDYAANVLEVRSDHISTYTWANNVANRLFDFFCRRRRGGTLKVLAEIPTTVLGTQNCETFEEYEVGLLPTGGGNSWGVNVYWGANVPWYVQHGGSGYTGNYLQCPVNYSGPGLPGLSYDVIPAQQDIDLVCDMFIPTNADLGAVMAARLTGPYSNWSGVWAQFVPLGNHLSLGYALNGTVWTYGIGNLDASYRGRWNTMRFKVLTVNSKTNLYAKMWQKGTTEPSSWTVTVTGIVYAPTVGYCGIISGMNSSFPPQIDNFGIYGSQQQASLGLLSRVSISGAEMWVYGLRTSLLDPGDFTELNVLAAATTGAPPAGDVLSDSDIPPEPPRFLKATKVSTNPIRWTMTFKWSEDLPRVLGFMRTVWWSALARPTSIGQVGSGANMPPDLGSTISIASFVPVEQMAYSSGVWTDASYPSPVAYDQYQHSSFRIDYQVVLVDGRVSDPCESVALP